MTHKIHFTTVVMVLAVLCFVPSAFGQLDDPIIGVANATGPCGAGPGGTICTGPSNSTPFSLTALENGSEALQAVVGTNTSPVYLTENDTGSNTFSLTFTGGLAFNQFLDCQENGGFAGSSCSISGALGKVGTGAQYGPPSGLTNGQYWNPDATLTFQIPASAYQLCPDGKDLCFDTTFASFGNGSSGTLTSMPEGGTPLAYLFLAGIVCLGGILLRTTH